MGKWVERCAIIKILIKFDLIEIIQFCLKIYDLWTHSHLWIGVWVGGSVGQFMSNH